MPYLTFQNTPHHLLQINNQKRHYQEANYHLIVIRGLKTLFSMSMQVNTKKTNSATKIKPMPLISSKISLGLLIKFISLISEKELISLHSQSASKGSGIDILFAF